MANRSDNNSILPRKYKRMISMSVARGYISPGAQERAVRKLFIAAHEHAKEAKAARTIKDAQPPNTAPQTNGDEA